MTYGQNRCDVASWMIFFLDKEDSHCILDAEASACRRTYSSGQCADAETPTRHYALSTALGGFLPAPIVAAQQLASRGPKRGKEMLKMKSPPKELLKTKGQKKCSQ